MLGCNNAVGIVSVLATCLMVGCGQPDNSETSGEDQRLLEAMLGDLKSDEESSTAATAPPPMPVSDPAEPIVAKATGERLELRLSPGDRFPLIKTVEQTLVQKSASAPMTARTRLEMTLVLQVEDVQPDLVQMSVRYSRIAYAHDLAGHRMEFDSATHVGVIPQDAIPYAGMVNNGFSFQIGRDNRIRKLIGYQQFLERCVQQIPVERRQTLLAEIGQRFGDDGVANFIDDTIGLLPYNTEVDPQNAANVIVGDMWTRERRLMQPVPVHMTSTYRLVDLNSETAEIDITGRIAAGTSVQSPDSGSIRIQGGHAVGACSVDRDTGLPLEMSVTQFVALTARDANGADVTQEKQVRTSIRTFPEVRGPVVGTPNFRGDIVPAAGNSNQVGTVDPIPTQTPPNAPRARYPQ